MIMVRIVKPALYSTVHVKQTNKKKIPGMPKCYGLKNLYRIQMVDL